MLAIPGRDWEGFAADPYLTGEAAYPSVLGLQASGVSACAKHFKAYEAETFRNVYASTASWSVSPADQQLPISANVNDETIHEVYLWPCAEAVGCPSRWWVRATFFSATHLADSPSATAA